MSKYTNTIFKSIFNTVLNLYAVINFLLIFFAPIIPDGLLQPGSMNLYIQSQFGVFFLYLLYEYWIKDVGERNLKLLFTNLTLLSIGLVSYYFNAKVFLLIILFRQTYILLKHLVVIAFEGKIYKKLMQNPAITMMLSFLLTIGVGALLLMLPSATQAGRYTSFIDALFTATSATCVTGLTVVDTGTHFTLFGQIVILLLIQVGGLGIMTISTAFAIIIGQRMSVGIEHLMQNVIGENTRLDMMKLLKNIVLLTFFVEALGALLLFLTFRLYTPTVSQAIYFSIFHSISAFCNAGFGLYPDNFMQFLGNVNINLTIAGLIILGGLGFSVLMEIRTTYTQHRSFSRLSLHTKLALVTTLCLIIAGSVLFFISEFSTVMKDFTPSERILASYFQSVTCRTAGFNTIDETQLSNASALISIVLMYIGASPGSTGGGIKTTTFAVLVLAIFSMLKGNKDVTAFRRKVSMSHIKEVLTLIGISLLFLTTLIFIMMLIEPFSFVKIVFEAVSAFGTVGLSMGITSALSTMGKTIIVFLMYLGRIGPLTLIYAMSISKRKIHLEYMEEKIGIG